MRRTVPRKSWPLLALAFVALSSSDVASQAAEPAIPRVATLVGPGPRFVVTQSDAWVDGVAGSATETLDLATGRYAEQIHAGTASYGDGFDGTHRWSNDASGMPVIDDTSDGALDARVWAHLFGRKGPEHLIARALPSDGMHERLRIRYGALTGPVDITLDLPQLHVSRIDDFSGATPSSARYSDYRVAGNAIIPFRTDMANGYSTTRLRVRSVRDLVMVSKRAFAPPAAPRDAELDGITAVPLDLRHHQVIVPIRIDQGPTLEVLFDSGSTNYLSPRAARLLGLPVVGSAKSGGFGAGKVEQRYTLARRLRIGRAELRDIPFNVLDDGSPDTDGAIGCEILLRFAVRFDFRRQIVQLARDRRSLGDLGTPLPIRTGSCQAETDATIDGLRGQIGIDTGSATGVDIMTPFVNGHRLIKHYWAWRSIAGSGIGGSTRELLAHANVFALGPFTLRDVGLGLGTMTQGAFADPTMMANVGIPVLSRFNVTLDYRSHRMWLDPVAPLYGIPYEIPYQRSR